MCTYTKISAAKELHFFDICKREGDFMLFCLSVISRSSHGHRSVGKTQRMKGYKQGQGTHKTIPNGQKVIWSVIYINITRPYINFCFRKVLYFSNLQYANINRRIWI